MIEQYFHTGSLGRQNLQIISKISAALGDLKKKKKKSL